jgi:transposase
MKMTTIGIDLAKAVFQLHGVDARGNAVLRKQMKRDQMVTFFCRIVAMSDRDSSAGAGQWQNQDGALVDLCA